MDARTQETRKHSDLHSFGEFGSDDYVCKTASNVNEASKLIEASFEYVTEMDGVKLFRKRK